jgi:hypothetical protein
VVTESKLAQQYRRRAQEVRGIAKGIHDLKERKKVLDIAGEYNELARAAEA